MPSPSSRRKLVALILLSTASISALIAVISGVRTYQQERDALSAEGTVVGMETRTYKGRERFVPRFTFTDARGARHTVTSSSARQPARYRAGDRLTVRFEQDQPEKAWVAGDQSRWKLTLVSGLIAVADAMAGAVLWIIVRRSVAMQGADIKPLATPPAHS